MYGAKAELEGWISWARRYRIPRFVELQKKIRRHFDAILSTIKHGLSNARIEAVNNKIKLTVRMG
jgi:transposase